PEVAERRVSEEVRHATRVQAGVVLDLLAEAAVLVPFLEQRAPARVVAGIDLLLGAGVGLGGPPPRRPGLLAGPARAPLGGLDRRQAVAALLGGAPERLEQELLVVDLGVEVAPLAVELVELAQPRAEALRQRQLLLQLLHDHRRAPDARLLGAQ